MLGNRYHVAIAKDYYSDQYEQWDEMTLSEREKIQIETVNKIFNALDDPKARHISTNAHIRITKL